MNTANTKAATVTVELITTCWAPLISCPCQQDLPSAKHYPYTCTTSTFAGCLGAGNTGHICMCLYVSDTMLFFFWEHISGHLLRLPFFAGSLLWFEMIWTYFNFGPKVPLECILWYDQKCAAGRHFYPQSKNQNWVSPKLDGLRWFNLVLKPYSQLWLHGVSLYFNLESGLSLASGWNLCCAAISFIALHRTPLISVRGGFVMLNWSIPHHGYLSMGWRRGQKIVTWPLGPNHRSCG